MRLQSGNSRVHIKKIKGGMLKKNYNNSNISALTKQFDSIIGRKKSTYPAKKNKLFKLNL